MGHGSGWIFGSTIDPDGTLNYLSVSSMQKAESCQRRWVYHYKHGIKEEDFAPQIRGVKGHELIEKYAETGDKSQLNSDILSAMHMIPEPGKDLRIEHDITTGFGDNLPRTHENAKLILQNAPLRAAGVPVLGYIDMMHGRGTNKGTRDINETIDPPGTIEVLDWKFTKDLTYAKQGAELVDTIQMAGYGKYVFNVLPKTEHVRLSHGYIPVKGKPEKRTALVMLNQVDKTWNRVEALARIIRDIAKEPNVDLVPANTKACRDYGRDCPARSVCTAGMHSSPLTSIIGLPSSTMSNPNSLASRIAASRETPAAPTPVLSTEITMEMKRLAIAEVRAKYPNLEAQLLKIRSFGMGFPGLSESAAKIVGQLLSVTPVNGVLEGTGELAQYIIPDITHFDGVIADLESQQTKPAVEDPAPAPAPSVVTDVGAEIPEPETKTRKARVKKSEPDHVTDTVVSAKINIFVDCLTEGMFTQPLHPIIDELMSEVSKLAGIDDARLAGEKNPMGFGKWKAALCAFMTKRGLAPGNYHVHGGDGELVAAVMPALQTLVHKSGGIFCKGAR